MRLVFEFVLLLYNCTFGVICIVILANKDTAALYIVTLSIVMNHGVLLYCSSIHIQMIVTLKK